METNQAIKQVIVMRTHFPDGKGGLRKVRQGKMIAQGAHASMKVFFDHFQDSGDGCYELGPDDDWDWSIVRQWVEGKFTKIVVGVQTEAVLLSLRDQARDANLPFALIQDAGDTEFGGVPTYTALCIGPSFSDKIDKITGSLSLL